jgi:lipopolysaccharide transport system permease protein
MTVSAEIRTRSTEPGRPTNRAPSPSPRAAANASVWGLVWTLVRTDFKARYHGTPSGFLWALLKPTAMFVVLVTVFSLIFRAEPNYKLNLVIGLFLWDFFADATKTGMTSLAAKGFLITKARFPRWIVVITSIANALITLTVFVAVLTIYLAISGRGPTLSSFAAFSAALAALIAITVGISLGSSVLFLRFRDLNQIWDMVTQAGFFVAPIVWPLGVVPERFHFYLYLWPPTPVIEFSRLTLVTGTIPSVRGFGYLALMAGGLLVAGILVYWRNSPRAAEYV